MKRLENDAKTIEAKINDANYEEGMAGNDKCRLLRQYNYLRERHIHAMKDWLICSNPSEATKAERRRHMEEANSIKSLTEKMCFAEKGF